MNKHELHGGARYVGGKVEKAVGDLIDSRDWQVSGVVNQVAGAGENLFGRARSVAHDLADATPSLIEEARDRTRDASGPALDAARRGSDAAVRAMRQGDERLIWAAAAAVGGYLVGWLIHRREA